jgi:drug/metabolite transporter (DMT)-like permease
MKPRGHDTLQLALGAGVISFTGVLVKLAHLGPAGIGFYRMVAGAAMLAAILLVTRTLPRWSRGSLLLAAAAGVVFATDLSFWHRSILTVGVGLATILVSLQVFVLAVIGVLFLRERLSLRLVTATLLAFAGVLLIIRFDPGRLTPRYAAGVAFGLTSAACYAAYILIMRRMETIAGPEGTVANLAVTSLVCALVLGVEALLTREPLRIPDSGTLVAVVGLGLIGQVLGWVTITRVLPRVRAALVGLVLLLQPALSVVWDMLFFGRRLTAVAVLGVALTLLAIYLGTTAGSRPAPSD